MIERRTTTCNRDCPDACGMVATVEDGRVVRLEGDKQHPITRGFLCYRTSHFLPLQYGPDRLTTPLLRKGGRRGELQPVSWDEALDFIAERLLAIRRRVGAGGDLSLPIGRLAGDAQAPVSDYFFERFGPTTTKRGRHLLGGGRRRPAAGLRASRTRTTCTTC